MCCFTHIPLYPVIWQSGPHHSISPQVLYRGPTPTACVHTGPQHQSLYNVIIPYHHRYSIEDLPLQRVYILDLNISLCWEQSSCVLDQVVASDLVLPKGPCQLYTGFTNTSK